jgi:hypothetical protein
VARCPSDLGSGLVDVMEAAVEPAVSASQLEGSLNRERPWLEPGLAPCLRVR